MTTKFTFEYNGKVIFDIVKDYNLFYINDVPVSHNLINIFSCVPFHGHCQKNGIPMKTKGDLFHWFKSMYPVIKTHEHRNFILDCMESYVSFYRKDCSLKPTNEVGWEDELIFKGEQERLTSGVSESTQYLFELEESEFEYRFRGVNGDYITWSKEVYPSFDRGLYTKNRYSYRPPEINFMTHNKDTKDNELFFGIELEISTKLSCRELQLISTHCEPKQEPFFYMKEDSSVSGQYENRVELVTNPMSLRRSITEWSTYFDKIERLCQEKNISVSDLFDTSEDLTNGIHIHLSKKAFFPGKKNKNIHMRKFIAMWNLWDSSVQRFYQKISRRPNLPKDSLYCPPHHQLEGRTTPRLITTPIDHSQSTHRSTCHQTRGTVELRLFQGIFNKEHMLGCIQIAKASFEFSRQIPYSKFNYMMGPKFKSWVEDQPGYRHAKEIMKCV